MKQHYLRLTIVLTFIISSATLYPQTAPLPKGLTPYEAELLPSFTFRSEQLTAPPSAPVRTAAEWEEVEYLVVTWDPNYQNILRQIVQAGVNECKVIITTQNEASVQSYLTSNGVSLTNVIFMDAQWNSIWTRDYSGNTVYANDVGERALVDWIYNRPRPYDNVMPSAHASQPGIPIFITDSGTNDLVNTGGNFMSDGLGTAFASELILEENAAGNPYNVTPKTEAQIDAIMQSYMGIDRYIKMPTLPYDGIHHIDMHMKLLDEETLLVSRYPPGIADGPQIEANIDHVLANHMSAFGTPYHVRWIDAPPSASGSYPDTGGYYRTYSNMTIVNKSILVPTYRPEVDTPALDYLQEIMPGYTIVGIDVDNAGETLIASSGAIHCITHTIGVNDPLLIVHQQVRTANAGTSVNINALIKHNSGISSAKIFWRPAGATSFNETAMTSMGTDNWTAPLWIDNSGSDMEYYIWAQANSGKSLARPLVAPDGFWTIDTQQLSVTEWATSNISAPYPNPAIETVNFKLNQIVGPVNVTITNLLGQKLFENTLENGNGTVSFGLNFDWKGPLLVTFKGPFGIVTRKIIKL